MKIQANLTVHTTKLLGAAGAAMPQWRAGSTQAEIRKSCEDAKCIFMLVDAEGESISLYIDPITGKTIEEAELTAVEGTISGDRSYHAAGGEVMRVDKCFALFGTPMLSAYKVATKFPERIGLEGLKLAMEGAPRNCRSVRGSLVGNASTVLTRDEIITIDRTIRNEGFHHILYDHAWRRHPWILKYATASCNHMQDVKDAIRAGASQCSIVLPSTLIRKLRGTKVDGFTMLQCLENVSPRISCSNCGGKKGPLCDAQTRSGMVIMFEQHGHTSWKRSKNTTMRNISKAAGVTLEEFQRVIRAGDRKAIAAIGRRAITKVGRRTAKRYRAFMEME